MPNEKVCLQCKKIFRPVSQKRVFCSVQCKAESQKLKIYVVCDGCGKRFEKYPYLKRKTNYCSLDCYRNTTRKKELKKCKNCNKLFRVKAYLVKKGFGQFCSRACQHALYPKRIIKHCLHCNKKIEVPPSKQFLVKYCSKKCQDDTVRDYVTRTCRFCKKDFQIPNFEVKRGRGTFCSYECYKKYKGETSIEHKIRACLEEHKVKFQQEVKIGKYRIDFLICNTPLIIECDGDYWHSIERVIEKDRKRDIFLREKGYKIFRFTESMINFSTIDCLNKIFDFTYA